MNHALLAKATQLLQCILEQKGRNKNGNWTAEFYAIGSGVDYISGRPHSDSPEVLILVRAGLVQIWTNPRNPDLPDCSLRLLEQNEARANEILNRYASSLQTAHHSGILS